MPFPPLLAFPELALPELPLLLPELALPELPLLLPELAFPELAFPELALFPELLFPEFPLSEPVLPELPLDDPEPGSAPPLADDEPPLEELSEPGVPVLCGIWLLDEIMLPAMALASVMVPIATPAPSNASSSAYSALVAPCAFRSNCLIINPFQPRELLRDECDSGDVLAPLEFRVSSVPFRDVETRRKADMYNSR